MEHGRGARSEFAYPARLRLVCGSCLAEGSGAVAPVEVVDSGGGLIAVLPEAPRRSERTDGRGVGHRGRVALDVRRGAPPDRTRRPIVADPSPLGAVGRVIARARTSRPGVLRAGECVLRSDDAPARRRHGALDRVRDHRRRRSGRCSGTTVASPTTVVAVPPSVQPIDDVADTVTVGARPIVDDRPDAERRSAAHHGPGVPRDRVPVRRRQRDPRGHRAVWAPPAGAVRVRGPRGSARAGHGLREGMGRLLARPSVLGLLGAVHGSSRGRTMGALGEPVVRARRRRRCDP